MGLVPAWVVMIILARELAVTGLRNLAAGRGMLIRASGLGKAKMVAQVTAILLLLLSRPMPALRIPGLVALAAVVGSTLVSGARLLPPVLERGAGAGRGATEPASPGLSRGLCGTETTGRQHDGTDDEGAKGQGPRREPGGLAPPGPPLAQLDLVADHDLALRSR